MCGFKSRLPHHAMNKALKKLEEIAYALVPNDRHETHTQFFHVAAVFKKNQIYSIGTNGYKTHPMAARYGHHNSQVHAELAAIIKFGDTNLKGYDLAVLRINRKNELAMSKPCRHCQKLLTDVDLKRIFYTRNDGKWEIFAKKP